MRTDQRGGVNLKADELDVFNLWQDVWAKKWVVLTASFSCAILGVIYSFWLPNVYKSETLLVERLSQSQPMIPSQLGGLASMAGISLQRNDISQKAIALETVKSRVFLADFISRHDIKPALFGMRGWDVKMGRVKWDLEVYDPQSKQWNWSGGEEPSDQEAVESFRDFLVVKESADAGFVYLGVKFFSPVLAHQWAQSLVVDLNSYMKNREIQQAQKNLDYLSGQLKKTAVANMQQVFYSLIEEQTKSLMLAEAQDEFVFRVIDPAVVPEKKSDPKRVLIIFVAGLFGCVLTLVILFIRFSMRLDREL